MTPSNEEETKKLINEIRTRLIAKRKREFEKAKRERKNKEKNEG